jgi:recombination protein RecT
LGKSEKDVEMNVVPERSTNPVAVFRQQVETRQNEFAAALPAHIPAERFVRVILTAVNRNPSLLHADRPSLFSSAMMAAADGLLCDGREAALVIYKTKKKDHDGREQWIEAVQYMPMLAGILKKCRNSGELSSIVARVVYGGDKFRNWIDDTGEHLEYEAVEDQDRNIVRNAFAMAKLKDGSIEVEVLKPADIEKIRSVSKSKDRGPWVDWWEEMAKKSAIRRLSKRLPLNTDLDDLIRRDDALYDLEGARAEASPGGRPQSLAGKLNALAAPPASDDASPPTIDEPAALSANPETGEIINAPAGAGETAVASSAVVADAHTQGLGRDDARDPVNDAQEPDPNPFFDAGQKAARAGSSRKAMPAELRAPGRESDAAEWVRGYDGIHA